MAQMAMADRDKHIFWVAERRLDACPWDDVANVRVMEGKNRKVEDRKEESAYLHGWQLTALMVILMLGQFIMGLDATVITTALPRITAEFHSLEDNGWYGSVFLLMVTATQPTWGKMFTHFNIKWTFVAAVLIFELGSVICAVARASWALILGRAIAGLGVSAMLAGGTMVIAYQVPLEKRALYFAVSTSMNGVASVVGPPIGGVFTDSSLTWRFCFWINLPIGGLLIIAGLAFLKEPNRPQSLLPLHEKIIALDLLGATVFTMTLVCLFVAFETGGTIYPWSDRRVWGWLMGFGAGVVIFAVLQHCLGEKASIPPRIISQRTVALGCLYTALIQLGFSVHTYFLPFYFQSAKDATASQSGLYLVPYLAAIMVVALVVGGLMVATGALTHSMLCGGVLFSIGSGLLTMLQPNSSTGLWVGSQILAGAGIGSSLSLSLVAVQSVLSPDDVGIGNGIWFLANFAGGSVGVAVSQTIFINVLEHELVANVPQVDPASIISAGATAISLVASKELVPIIQQAFDTAVTRSFIFPATAAALGTLCVLGMQTINLKKQ